MVSGNYCSARPLERVGMSGGEPLAMAFSICTIANVCIKNGGIRAYCFVTALMACGVARVYVFESGIPSESTNTQRSQ